MRSILRVASALTIAILVVSCSSTGRRAVSEAESQTPTSQPTGCLAADLRATITGNDGATGHAGSYVVLYKPTPGACTVTGPAILELIDRNGRVVAHSTGRRPFMAYPTPSPHPLTIEGSSRPSDWDTSKHRVVETVIAQGQCPGGVFPPGSSLRIALPRIGAVHLDGFEGTLPFDYRCDDQQPPPRGTPELLIGDLLGPDDFK